MSQKPLQLITSVSLVAFVFATGIGAALPQCAQGSSCSSCRSVPFSLGQTESQTVAQFCPCCSLDRTCLSSDDIDACPNCGDIVSDGFCRCQTANLPTTPKSELPSCPGPGTCAFCMAKTLGLNKMHFSVVLIPCLEQHVAYALPTHEGLISGAVDRPPRTSTILRLLI